MDSCLAGVAGAGVMSLNKCQKSLPIRRSNCNTYRDLVKLIVMLLQLLNIGLKSSLGILAPLIFGIFILESSSSVMSSNRAITSQNIYLNECNMTDYYAY